MCDYIVWMLFRFLEGDTSNTRHVDVREKNTELLIYLYANKKPDKQ